MLIDITGAGTGKGSIEATFKKGSHYAAKGIPKTVVSEGKTGAFCSDSAAAKNSDGKIIVSLKPVTATSALLADLHAKAAYLERDLTI